MHVTRSMILDAPITVAWQAIRRFDGVVDWNPGVTAARMETGQPTEVGAVRHLDIVDGTAFRETLLAHSDVEHFYTYDIIDSPLPVSNYVSTHRLIAITVSQQTLSIWESHFDCAAADADTMARVVGDDIYVGGMRGLDAFLASQRKGE